MSFEVPNFNKAPRPTNRTSESACGLYEKLSLRKTHMQFNISLKVHIQDTVSPRRGFNLTCLSRSLLTLPFP